MPMPRASVSDSNPNSQPHNLEAPSFPRKNVTPADSKPGRESSFRSMQPPEAKGPSSGLAPGDRLEPELHLLMLPLLIAFNLGTQGAIRFF